MLLAVLSLLLLITSVFSLSSCFYYEAESKEEIIENVQNTSAEDTEDYSFVMQYFRLWGIPKFDTEKFSWVEDKFNRNFKYEDGLPEKLEHASLAADYFLANFYDSIDLDNETEVTDALITSYVDVIGDPYSIYRVPEEYTDYTGDINGKFGGIGVIIEYDHRNETLMISTIYVDSPAEKAGFKVGDYIWAVDGVTVSKMGYLNAVYAVRGEIGTEVKITVKRGEEFIDLVCTRAEVEETSVDYKIDENGYGYIRVTGFKANTYKQFVAAVDYMESAGVPGVIFDMRNNPGGLLDSVCEIMSYLVPTGQTLVTYELSGNTFIETKAKDDVHPVTGEKIDHVLDLPMVVLCNEYTASAGEIFTAAIRDYRNDGLIDATIVGTTTYKKGIMQTTYTYEDGSSITLTIAYYNPPCGENYHGEGVNPDVHALNTATEDTQYKTAVEELKKLINANNNLQI